MGTTVSKLWGYQFLLVLMSIGLSHFMIAKDNKDSLQSFSRKNCGAKTLFIENNGQIGDQNGKPNPAVKYPAQR
jgi:hypothetical protein